MGVDFCGRRVLTNQATGGRKLASGHEYPMCQDVASGHPKGRSAAKEPRRGLTRGSVLTPSPTSCGSSHPLFAIYARIYTAANIGYCVLGCVRVFRVLRCLGGGWRGRGFPATHSCRRLGSLMSPTDRSRPRCQRSPCDAGAGRHEAQSELGQRSGPPKPLVTVTLGGLPSRWMICHPDHVTSLKSTPSPWVDAIVWKRQLGEARTSA